MSNSSTGKTIHSDMARVHAMRDEDIDFSDIPPIPAEWFKRAQWRMPEGGLKLDDIPVDHRTWGYYLRQGQCGLDLAGEVLREYAEAHPLASSEPTGTTGR